MYERAFRFPAERSAIAGVFVAALTLYAGAQPAQAQSLGRPSVVVDESVLDQLGPPPQTLPDVLLQQQPQTYRPAQRVGSDAAAVTPSPGRLLPPPASMPKSRVMLPSGLQSTVPEAAPAVRPQTARVPKPAPQPQVDRLEPPSAPPVAAATPAPSVVPPKITPPTVSVPEAPAVTPPPAAPAASAPEVAAPESAAKASGSAAPTPPETPPETPAAKAEAPKAAPSVPKLVPPAPSEAAVEAVKAAPPQPEAPALPKAASIPPPPPAAVAPASPMPPVAGKAPSPRASRPTPPIAEPSTQANKETGGGGSSSPAASPQIASLPPASSPEILDDGQMYRIPFGSVSSDISEEGKKHLDELAQRLKKDNALRLQLLGYAAGTEDSASKARRTSLFRALSVRTYLMKQGIRSTRMDVRALGNLAEGGAPDRVDAVIRK